MESDRATSRRATSLDVARRAGCSQAAVSLWTTGKYAGRIGPDLQARISAAVSELGYRANRSARRLSGGTGKSISLFFPGALCHYVGSILDGLARGLSREWQITIVDIRPGDRRHAPESIIASAVGAGTSAVLVAAPSRRELLALERVQGPQIIVIDAPEAPPGAHLVTYDEARAMSQAVSHLRSLRHARIGHVHLATESFAMWHRRKLLIAQLVQSGAEVLCDEFSPTQPDALHHAQTLLGRWHHTGVTAVICDDERLAYVLMRAARALHIRIPHDFSLLTFSDSDAAALLDPGLAAVRLPRVALGRAAASLLMQADSDESEMVKMIGTEYIPRPSVALAPKA